jgi:hypothetical protein
MNEPGSLWLRIVEWWQIVLYHLTGNTSMPPRWGAVVFAVEVVVCTAAYVAVWILAGVYARSAAFLPAAPGPALEVEPEAEDGPVVAGQRFTPAGDDLPPWPALEPDDDTPQLEPAPAGPHLHVVPNPPESESEAA